MSTDTADIPALEPEPAVRGILALLVAERQEREDRGIDRAERILARAGLGDEEIASLTGYDANRVRPQSVIDRARETLTRRA